MVSLKQLKEFEIFMMCCKNKLVLQNYTMSTLALSLALFFNFLLVSLFF